MSSGPHAPFQLCAWLLLLGLALCWQLEAPDAAGRSVPQRPILFVAGPPDTERMRLDIFTINPDGSGRTNLTRSESVEFDPVWSLDGKQIAFSVLVDQTAGEGSPEYRADIYRMNADGTRRRRLTRLNTLAFYPTWSPDGKRIAFSSLSFRGPNPWRKHVMDADGKNLTPLGEGLMPAWSPDGRKLLYSVLIDKGDGEESADLCVRDVAGRHTRRLGPGMMGAWSPDGKRIAYVAGGVEETSDLFVMNADGSQPRQLTRTPQIEMSPQWSADGRRLFFVRSNDLFELEGDAEQLESVIYVVDAEGHSEKPLTGKDPVSMLRGEVALGVYIGEKLAAAFSTMFSR